ncbi:MAG: hypothetical protein B7Y25_05605 [Alphaproteobacteria bacterium 16-39-46]|nr:MAG: hypothetical protein B7Y25_05605 [Alphaproteobacteria bacterium 16-39-46]OZA42622.1 MAG: hypothetical protein B7X84_05505 [Alphaproteobacteria bacterium 17-39-52]HQS84400.1 hypothetical protein [Alphaproteobacteria bacterium]HQS93946.1 hypothetical protein [Alphaproteobacteria bacterium]
MNTVYPQTPQEIELSQVVPGNFLENYRRLFFPDFGIATRIPSQLPLLDAQPVLAAAAAVLAGPIAQPVLPAAAAARAITPTPEPVLPAAAAARAIAPAPEPALPAAPAAQAQRRADHAYAMWQSAAREAARTREASTIREAAATRAAAVLAANTAHEVAVREAAATRATREAAATRAAAVQEATGELATRKADAAYAIWEAAARPAAATRVLTWVPAQASQRVLPAAAAALAGPIAQPVPAAAAARRSGPSTNISTPSSPSLTMKDFLESPSGRFFLLGSEHKQSKLELMKSREDKTENINFVSNDLTIPWTLKLVGEPQADDLTDNQKFRNYVEDPSKSKNIEFLNRHSRKTLLESLKGKIILEILCEAHGIKKLQKEVSLDDLKKSLFSRLDDLKISLFSRFDLSSPDFQGGMTTIMRHSYMSEYGCIPRDLFLKVLTYLSRVHETFPKDDMVERVGLQAYGLIIDQNEKCARGLMGRSFLLCLEIADLLIKKLETPFER